MSKFRRLSTILKLGPSKAPAADTSSLATFLVKSKEKYLADGAEWTVVMGNEAGDLDSVASAIAFAWIRSEIHKKPSIPLIQIARDDLNLRAENLHALGLAGITDPAKQLVSSSDVPTPLPSTSFALVDHNRLGTAFTNDNARVVAVIDHHADEGLYSDSADPRTIEPAGSCSSHVATVYARNVELPKELATLLLCAILVDTDGLKPGGKALKVDHDAAAYLIPLSTFASTSVSASSTIPPTVKALSDELSRKKMDVSHLGAWDLLRRDYKEYTYTLHWHPSSPPPEIKAGLATVPVKLKAWGAGSGSLEREALRWMDTQGLSILGILTSFRDTGKNGLKFGKSGKGKHKREMAWFVRGEDAHEIATRLWKGLEADDQISVKPHKISLAVDKVHTRVYKQGNPNATRKATAPLLKKIVESSS